MTRPYVLRDVGQRVDQAAPPPSPDRQPPTGAGADGGPRVAPQPPAVDVPPTPPSAWSVPPLPARHRAPERRGAPGSGGAVPGYPRRVEAVPDRRARRRGLRSPFGVAGAIVLVLALIVATAVRLHEGGPWRGGDLAIDGLGGPPRLAAPPVPGEPALPPGGIVLPPGATALPPGDTAVPPVGTGAPGATGGPGAPPGGAPGPSPPVGGGPTARPVVPPTRPAAPPTRPAAPPTRPAEPTTRPEPSAERRNAYRHIQAEAFDAQSGTVTESGAQSMGGRHIGYISAGDWLRFDNVDFTGTAPRAFTARLASGAAANGSLQVRVGNRSSAPVASFTVRNTGGWSTYHHYAATAKPPTGVHTVFVSFAGGSGNLMNLDWILFNGPHG